MYTLLCLHGSVYLVYSMFSGCFNLHDETREDKGNSSVSLLVEGSQHTILGNLISSFQVRSLGE
jgi:hypothetical protein